MEIGFGKAYKSKYHLIMHLSKEETKELITLLDELDYCPFGISEERFDHWLVTKKILKMSLEEDL